MTKYTFSITVEDEVAGSEPMTMQSIMDYILIRLESESVIRVSNLVRDY